MSSHLPGKNKKNYQPVSRILSPINRRVIIYLAATLLLQSCCLPFGIERAALKRRYTWHYSTQGLPNLSITAKTRELLPHVFTLIPNKLGTVIFCGPFSFAMVSVTTKHTKAGC